ncbi:hypothetical protein QTJ16_005885 [Diplocarpon rosae]|uniref:5'-3' DNA helicase ZGRF1-like N-terminal domain-containing protein n=1 Tax=Diplocarpon rosae TaxID=946125 RepID=A0AAD9WAU7_9HELO|nr:hypothetical protein QTJ16_005885 [Diplocarpon rosae]PBP26618.1 hypothetical protein BUE80_DR002441 [Diplocarpon rosae]
MAIAASHTGAMNASMDVPQSQNTAPVLEFRCLFTPDIRRKQKRWQDGRLKFHTFNKRVMVYDERSNFVGDAHWKGGLDFEQGEELELERGGILVEVGECIGKRDQDLFELVEKRVKEREERAAAKNAMSPGPIRSHNTPARSAHYQPKPLNTLLTPTGHYGRALVPNTSPFEKKQNAGGKWDQNEPPAKRRRPGDATSSRHGYAQNLMGATLSLGSTKPSSTPTIRYEPFKTRPIAQHAPANTIDLTEDDEEERRAADARRNTAKEERNSMMERPIIKQKKYKRKSPRKSGYASNLTGTPLVMSRPESRQPTKTMSAKLSTQVRYQEKEKPQLEPGESSIEIEQHTSRQFQEVKKSKAGSQAGMEHENSSTDEQHNLTAVNTHPNRSIPQSRKKSKDRHSQAIEMDGKASFSHAEDGLEVAPIPRLMHEKLARRKDLTPKDSEPSMLGKVKRVRSSSPRRVSPATPALQQNESFCDSKIQGSSAAEPIPDRQRPLPGLRIRSRAPRKMMMLMQRPGTRSSGANSSVGRDQAPPRSSEALNTTLEEVVLSQATIALDVMCQKQEEILQARINRMRPKPQLVDISSSDAECSIDHQKIDLLLSRKSVTIQKQVELLDPVLEPGPLVNTNPPARRIEQVSPAEKPNHVAANKKHSAETNVFRKSYNLPEPGVETRTDGANKARRPSPLAGSSQNTIHKEPLPSAKQTAEDAHLADHLVQSLNSVMRVSEPKEEAFSLSKDYIRECTSIQEKSINYELQESRPNPSKTTEPTYCEAISSEKPVEAPGARQPKAADLPQDIEAENSYNNIQSKSGKKATQPGHGYEKLPGSQVNQALKSGAKSKNPKPAGLPEQSFSAMQSASARFRAMIQPSSSSINLIAGTMSCPANSTSSRLLHYSRGKPASNEAAVELSLTPSPPVREALEATPELCSGPDFSSVTPFTIEYAALSTPDLAIDNSRMGPPKAKLANPATRGKTLQKLAASTVDAVNPLFKDPMPPPPPAPRIAIRIERSGMLVGVEDQANGAEPEGKVALEGPWSREAFDLFGLRGPPQQNTGSKAAAA